MKPTTKFDHHFKPRNITIDIRDKNAYLRLHSQTFVRGELSALKKFYEGGAFKEGEWEDYVWQRMEDLSDYLDGKFPADIDPTTGLKI